METRTTQELQPGPPSNFLPIGYIGVCPLCSNVEASVESTEWVKDP